MLGLNPMTDLSKKLHGAFRQSRNLVVTLMACSLMLLTGCVKYDLEINFASQNHGEIIQHIQIGERLSSFSSETARLWLESIKRRTRDLGGKTHKISAQEILVNIPFNNGVELADKINQFMNPVGQPASGAKKELNPELSPISAAMSVTQNNWLFALRNRLIYDLDLRSLGVISTNGNLLISPGALLDLQFALRTPWGGKVITDDAVTPGSELEAKNGQNAPLMPEIIDQEKTFIWHLQPGQMNHIEVIFWVPSPIGIGAGIIALFIGISMYVKNLLSPPQGSTEERSTEDPTSGAIASKAEQDLSNPSIGKVS
jgi:hypothetical protein